MAGVFLVGVGGLIMALFFSPEIASGLKRRRRRQARRRARNGFD
ncbi:MAG: hypothetical protein RL093_26 [Pseudomonadota bacterium]|jgi:hypothetical protein